MTDTTTEPCQMTVPACVIVVMGVSGSGKSTIGSSLAARFHCAFIEGDDLHSAENVAKMRAGIALTDDDRWPWLGKIGTMAGHAAQTERCVVVACSALKKSYRDRIRECAACTTLFVLLDVGLTDLERRMAARVDHYMPATLLQSQVSLLERPGPGEAAMSFKPDGGDLAMLDQILAWLRRAIAVSAQAT